MSIKYTLDKAIRILDSDVYLRNIVDTWNVLEKYGIEKYKTSGNGVIIDSSDYNKMLNAASNKEYIKGLRM